jgi:hypothetical protein
MDGAIGSVESSMVIYLDVASQKLNSAFSEKASNQPRKKYLTTFEILLIRL